VVVAIFAILLVGGVSNAGWVGYSSLYGYMTVFWDQDGNNDVSESLWAYYIATSGVADYAWIYAYVGMGLDLLPYFGNYRAYNWRPSLYIDDYGPGWLGWSDGSILKLNSYSAYMQTVTASNWASYLPTQAWYKGSTITHEMSHVFYYQVTGNGNPATPEGYWNNF